MNHIKQVHARSIRNGIDQTQFLVLKLLEIPDIGYARSLLDSASASPATFVFNKLLRAYAVHGPFHQCLSLYNRMLSRGQPPPNLYSFTFLFSACATFSQPMHGQALHARFCKLGFQFDAFVSTSLLDMYVKCGRLGSGRQVFDEMSDKDVASWNSMVGGYAKYGDLLQARELFEAMPIRNVISWTSMVSGFSQNGLYEEAVAMFMRMWEEGDVRPNEVTLASVLPACANLGELELGKRIEAYARENGLIRNIFVSNALVEMYAKCGNIDQARQVFDEIGENRNLCSWNSMIMGLAVHGRWKEGLELFYEMRARGISPDDITFVGVLMACTHGGLVEQGQYFFGSMQIDFSLMPKLEHYGCMIDLLGRAGLLHEAYHLITTMPMKPDSVIWGALLGACSFHCEVELAEIAAQFLTELEPWNPGNHVILSNIYASSKRWDCVAREWKLIKGKQQQKQAGYSLIELDGNIYKFLVEDKSHPRSKEIYSLLDKVLFALKLVENVPHIDLHIESFD